MAEEIPISDVLCNATEYLCKLGSNLRSRSENLKHKRISKDKLRNAHAVRKAASKLLLMCELSKKSLENVENGVKRVLTIVDASRCSPGVGAKTKNVSSDSRSSKKEYFYFEFDSCKLRISKKILLKHYTSLKVHAKSMPVTMLDKYPVYYDCNLYKKRKKMEKSENENKNEVEKINVKLKNSSQKNETSGSSSEDTDNVGKNLAKKDDASKLPKKVKNITETTHGNDKTESSSENEDGNKTVSKDSETKQIKTLLNNDNEMESSVSHIDKHINMDKAKSKKKNNDIESETSHESKHQSESTIELEPINERICEESKSAEKKDNELKNNEIPEKSRKSKTVRFLYETSESTNVKDSEKGNDRKKRKLDKESVCTDTVDLIDSPDDTERSQLIEKAKQDKDEESGSKQKPMIKLVSLNKLLKPDLIQKLDGNNEPKVMKQTSIKTYSSKTQKKDGTCLLEKRKEVSAFKPKKFSVIVMRLPKFSDNFLCKYGLKKIVKDGNIVYKKGSKGVMDCEMDLSENKSQKKSKKKNTNDDNDKIQKELHEGVAKTKHALLNSESDSSDTMTKPSRTKQKESTKKDSVFKTKAALLNSDSDSSENMNRQNTSKKHSLSRSKTALLNSDSDSSDGKNKEEAVRKHSLSDAKGKSKTSEKDNLSKSKTALLNSGSDKSDSENRSKTSNRDTVTKSNTALLNSDSDTSSKSKQETERKDSSSKTKTALLNSDSDKSDSEKKSKISKKDTINKSKAALLDSDSDNSDNSESKRKSKTSEKDTLSKSKTALLNSDSDTSSKSKQETERKDSLSKTKTALPNSDSDKSENENKSKTSKKDTVTKSKSTLLDSDSDKSDSKKKSKTSEKDILSKSKSALLNSDSDKSDSENRSKTSKKDTVNKSKAALLDSDSDNSTAKGKSKTSEEDTLSKSKTALLNSDSDKSDSENKFKTSKKDTIAKSKAVLLDSDSDKSDSKGKSKTSENDTLSKSKTALLNSDSHNSDSENKSKTSKKDTKTKSKAALLNSDSDNSDCKGRSKTSENDTLSKSKTALLDSDSDKSDSENKSKTLKKDTITKSKAALLDSDSDNSDSKERSKTSENDTLSKSKAALLDSDSNTSSKSNQETRRNSPSKTSTALLNSDSDKSDDKKNSEPSKTNISKNKTELLDSDLHNSDSKSKSNSKNDSLSERPISENTIETSSKNLDKSGQEPNKSSDLKDSPSENRKEKNTDADESKSGERETQDCKKDSQNQTTPKSKRKMIRESMQAKKMLLTYSSSSDTDDEQLKNTMKDVRNSLLRLSSSSGDEIDVKKIVQAKRRQLVTPSDSDGSLKKSKLQEKKKKELSRSEESSINQVDGTKDEQSDTSSSQMGRSKTKVASSSNQSSENMDSNDIEINRLTDLSSLNRRRRRDTGKKAGTRSTRKMPKAPLIDEEALGPETSDAASDVESDVGEVEDLPAVSLQDLNGDGINHLAKEDLLAQSDSSSSQNDKANGSEEDKKEDSDEEDTVKSIRRKPNAISSDSEVGSSRRKEEKVSDFEDSEADSEPRRKTKRKKKGSDSDASQSSNDGSKKKRRRIKQVNDSEGSGSDSENEGKNKHGRKNIRKVMSKDQLEEATKKAARQEKERIARIAERQKLYNNLEFDETGKPDEVVLDKVILDFDPETKEPLIEVDRGLVKKLKPHQANGIKFMWNACFESVKRIKKDRGSGCILAHCMGLGKTLQVVSLTHTLLTHGALTGVRRVLVVCPLSTVLNWVNEFTMWLKHANTDYEVDVFELSRHKQNSERSWQLQQWVECGGVCVLGYEMFRNLSADNNKKFKKKMLKTFQEALVDPGPDLVVCDEGHLLKNEKTSLSQSMNRVRTLRRIVLTGTPLQNNLKEYYCMVQFVKPNLLGKYNEYLNRFVNPITNGQYTDSTERDISIMKRRSHVLHTMLDGAVQRRDYGVLAPFLPPKHEFVLFITLTEIQIKLYQHYLDNYSRRPLPGKSSGFLFPDFQSLQRIWTHPLVLKYNSERYEIMQQKKRDKEEEDSEGSIADFIDDDSTPEESSTEESSDDLSDMSDDSRKKSKKKKSAKKGKGKDAKATGRRGTRANPIEMAEEDKPNSDIEEVKYENPTEWWMKLVTDEELEDIRHSHKLLLLFDILRQCEAIGDKLLVFSQSLYSLDLIEHFLGKVDEATQEGRIDEKLAGHVGSWSPGVDYFRLDGSTSCENRSIWCKNFNREDNPRARLFLISTRAGGLGINLVAANRVVIFDVSWNPSHDVQSIFRVYRFGQKKPCYIYRFLAMGTMEEKIYERQVTKQAISKRVIDEQQIDRHYAANDLAELYKFEPEPPEPRPVPSLPKDRLFAEMLKDHEKQIYRFHEHDSLLENKEEETLSEEERKRAWEEFENEKRAPPPAPFPSTWSMHNGMASLLQQQQQQLAYTALAAMIRKDMPNITDNQMRDMLPIICNANPGLMQKMNEIYKYAAQPGLMNPSMMNPVMNPASGMSTSSSLQYEPPWQRQHQQQQQMRLQQLMQQQHSMGAKYYAGGLGSRDPVAMALQQQRAREFLLGPGSGAPTAAGAGRPRGRPPLQPRAPAAADVVNLDSD